MLSEHSSLPSRPGPLHLPTYCLLSLTTGDPYPGSHSLKTQGHSGNSGASASATTRGCSARGVEPGLKAGAGTGSSLEAWIPAGTSGSNTAPLTQVNQAGWSPVCHPGAATVSCRILGESEPNSHASTEPKPTWTFLFSQSSSFRSYVFKTAGKRSFLNSNFPANSKCWASKCFQDSLPSKTPWPPAGRGFRAPLPRAKESKWTNKSKRWIFRMHPITPNNQDAYVVFANYKLALAKSIASHCTTSTFAICLCEFKLPRCSCWPSALQEGVQDAVRHSVRQGIWWDRSLDP